MASPPTAARIRRGYIDTPEGQIHYREAGSGPPLVLVHQTSSSSNMWWRVIPALAEHFHVLAPDTPGFGESDPPAERPPEGMAYYARRLTQFLDHFELGEVSLWGHHTGAVTSMELAATQPVRVRRLVTSGAVAMEDPEQRARLRDDIHHWQPDSDGEFLNAVPIRERLRGAMVVDDPEFALIEAINNLRAGPNYWWTYYSVFSWDPAPKLPQITAPALCMYAENAHFATVEGSRRAAELIPDARVVGLEGVADCCVSLAPDVVLAEALPFLLAGKA